MKEWNEARKSEDFVPDFSDADLFEKKLDGFDLSLANFDRANASRSSLKFCNFDGASINHANFCFSDLRGSTIEEASCRFSNFRDTDLRLTSLAGSDFTGSDFSRATASSYDVADFFDQNQDFEDILNSLSFEKHFELGSEFGDSVVNLIPVAEAIFNGANFADADIAGFIDFSFGDLANARGNFNTRVPENFERPPHWQGDTDAEQRFLLDFLDVAQPERHAVVLDLELKDERISVTRRSSPHPLGVAEVFNALRNELEAAQDHMGNISFTIRKAIQDYFDSLPSSIELMSNSDQIKIGLLGENMKNKIAAELPQIKVETPEKVGILTSIAFSHDALRPGLPLWSAYLRDAAGGDGLDHEDLNDIEKNVEEVRSSTLTRRDIFDAEVELRVAEFLRFSKDDPSLRKKAVEAACWAIENVMSFLCRWVRDTLHEGFERAKKPLAIMVAITVVATVASPILKLAEISPHIFGWLPRTLDIFSEILPKM